MQAIADAVLLPRASPWVLTRIYSSRSKAFPGAEALGWPCRHWASRAGLGPEGDKDRALLMRTWSWTIRPGHPTLREGVPVLLNY